MIALTKRACAILVLLVFTDGVQADIGFHLTGSTGIGGLTSIAAPPQLAVDANAGVLVLVRDNSEWAVVSTVTGATIATGAAENSADVQSNVLFADVTGDDLTDVVVCRMETALGSISQRQIVLTVTLYPGPDLDRPAVLAAYAGDGGLMPVAIGSVDGDFDGSPELWLSIPDGVALNLGDCLSERLNGTTLLLDPSAGDTSWVTNGYYTDVAAARNGVTYWFQAVGGAALYTKCGDASGVMTVTYDPVTVTGDGSFIQPFKPCPSPTGGGSNDCYSFGSQFVFDLDAGDGAYEVVTIAECEYDNGGELSLCIAEEGYDVGATVALHRVTGPNSATRVWSRTLSLMNGSTAHHSLLDDQILVLSGDSIVALDLSSGVPTQTEPILPAGTLHQWSWPDGVNNDPWLVVVLNDSVKWYTIDMATDVEEIENEPVLPESFVLGEPYPNPFNATVSIPLTVNRRLHLKATVYDLLGRQVALLFDGKSESGELNLTWEGMDAASGVYLVKVSAEGQSSFAKMVLLK